MLIVGDLRAFVIVDALGTNMLLGFRCLWGLVLMDLQLSEYGCYGLTTL